MMSGTLFVSGKPCVIQLISIDHNRIPQLLPTAALRIVLAGGGHIRNWLVLFVKCLCIPCGQVRAKYSFVLVWNLWGSFDGYLWGTLD